MFRIKSPVMNYYVYILLTEKNWLLYKGYFSNLEKWVHDHNAGLVHLTKLRRPLKQIYFEGCLNQQNATRREKFLIQRGKWK